MDSLDSETSESPLDPQIQRILEYVEECNPDAILYDGFENALIGVAEHWAPAEGHGAHHNYVALYDYAKCVQILVDRDEMSEEEAVDYMEFNVTGGYVGPYTPVFAHTQTM